MDMKIVAVVLALFALAACTQTATTGDVANPQTNQIAAGPTNVDMPTGDIVDVSMTAKDWEFSPAEIRVKKGQTVRINVTSTDGDHGIAIEGYGNSVKFNEGETKTLEFTADKAGEFAFYCNVPCGPGHRTMRGKLIVE